MTITDRVRETDIQTVGNMKGNAMTHTLALEMALFVSGAPVDHTQVLRLRRENIARVQSTNGKSLN